MHFVLLEEVLRGLELATFGAREPHRCPHNWTLCPDCLSSSRSFSLPSGDNCQRARLSALAGGDCHGPLAGPHNTWPVGQMAVRNIAGVTLSKWRAETALLNIEAENALFYLCATHKWSRVASLVLRDSYRSRYSPDGCRHIHVVHKCLCSPGLASAGGAEREQEWCPFSVGGFWPPRLPLTQPRSSQPAEASSCCHALLGGKISAVHSWIICMPSNPAVCFCSFLMCTAFVWKMHGVGAQARGGHCS